MVRPRCIVSYCENLGRHKFPKDEDRKRQWIQAIEHVKPKMIINAYSGICSDHFRISDFSVVPSYWNNYYSAKILKKTAVPSVFKWNKTSVDDQDLVEQPSSSTQDSLSFNPERVKATYSREMGKSRAEYMRDYRQKKREEKLKSGEIKLVKRIPRSSTQRSRDFRARAKNLILSQASTADPTTALPNPLSPSSSTSTCNTGPAEIHPRPVDTKNERLIREDVEFHVDQIDRDEFSHFPSGQIIKQEKPNNIQIQPQQSLLKINKLRPETNEHTLNPGSTNIQNANTSCNNRLKHIENHKRFLPSAFINNCGKRLKISNVPPKNSNIVGKVRIVVPKASLLQNNSEIQETSTASRLPPNVIIKMEKDVETDYTDDLSLNNGEFIQDDGMYNSCLPLEVNIKTEKDEETDFNDDSLPNNSGFVQDESKITSCLPPEVKVKTEPEDGSYTMIEVEVDMLKPIKQENNDEIK